MRKQVFFTAIIILSALNIIKAQGNFNISTDIQSRYIWRGQALGGNTPSIQPSMKYNIKGFELGAWGAFSTSQLTTQEIDLYLSYTFLDNMFTAIITDYSFPKDFTQFDYFDYGKNTTHVLEAGVVFNGLKNLPINASIYTNFYGADSKDINNDNVMSTYFEISYNPFIEKINTSLSVFSGFALNGGYTTTNPISSVNNKIYGYYGNVGFACVNLGLGATKNLKITESFSLPISTKLIFNPEAKKAFFTLSTGIKI